MVMYMGSLRKYNPIPAYVWALMSICLLTGYFLGGYVQSRAIENDNQKTCQYGNRK